MKRKKNEMSDGSILLLDTMCNAFGGIIFISFLLVVLINSTSAIGAKSDATDRSPSKLIESEVEREELTRKLSELQVAVQAQSGTAGVLVSPELLKNAARLKSEQARHAQLVRSKSEIIGEHNHVQIEINKTASKQAGEKRKLDEERKKIAELQLKLDEAAKKQARAATAPRTSRAEGLQPVDYFLQQGKLYGPVVIEDRRNNQDFTFPTDGSDTFIKPIPESGLTIAEDGRNVAALQRKFSVARRGVNSVNLHVWNDSYRQFNSIRLALENSGLPYAIALWDDDDSLVFGKAHAYFYQY
jgi:hypothetical protein